MIRMVLYLVGVAVVATGLAWLADRPGSLLINWEGYEVETSVFRAVVLFALAMGVLVFVGSLMRQLLTSPASLGRYFSRRRQEKGLDALSSGMIAIGAGDRNLATRYAVQARRTLPNEPLTQLLRAQAAQLAGDRSTSRRIFEAMLGSPDTEQLGLRGLYLEAEREGESEAARQFAERALRLNPKLGWPVEALFDMQCKAGDFAAALETLAAGRRSGHFDKALADRRRAVLLTAEAQALEEANSGKAQQLALEAHNLAPDLIPAAAIAARQLAARGATPKAAKVVERTWRLAPHPELALVYAFARPGDSPRDRLERIKRLARMAPDSPEGPVALATAAIEARQWAEARSALSSLIEGGLTQRVCTLMARIEGGEHEDAGRVREWLSRAVTAPPDPAWTADGVVSDTWAPVSPVTGALDRFAWKVPPETTATSEAGRALKQLEEMALLGAEPVPGEIRATTPKGAAKAYAPPTSARVATPSSTDVGPLRHRAAEADRPITVEVRPVPDDDAVGATTSGVPLHPLRRGADDAEIMPVAASAGEPSKVAKQP
ncbi:MAG: heme biosynthesis HemY N-terminal domain-containing protein [Hyphomicrobiaceae bacterium]|nr:heme biosynthesis HemY N-terminal domain-containing protein [Hyphomicrobiaceae bacterium]